MCQDSGCLVNTNNATITDGESGRALGVHTTAHSIKVLDYIKLDVIRHKVEMEIETYAYIFTYDCRIVIMMAA
jgi:hypothetical protein